MHNLNEQLFFFINGKVGSSHFLDSFFLFVTTYTLPILFALVFLWFFVVIPRKQKTIPDKILAYRNAFNLLVSVLFTWVLVEALKGFVSFPRPFQILEGVRLISPYGSFDSFPSAHSAFSFALASFVFLESKIVGVTLFVFAVLIGISRIFVGVHFPLDVVVGALLGIVITISTTKFLKHYNI